MPNHAEKLEKLISKVISDYSKENNVCIRSDADYISGTIRIKILSKQ